MWPFNSGFTRTRIIELLERELEATRRVNEELLKVINELMVAQRVAQVSKPIEGLSGEPGAKQQVPRRVQLPRLKQQLEREASDRYFKAQLDQAEHASDQASRPE